MTPGCSAESMEKRRVRLRPSTAVIVVFLTLLAACLSAATGGPDRETPDTKSTGKIGSVLTDLENQYFEHLESGRSIQEFTVDGAATQIQNGYVLIDATASRDASELSDDLRILGAIHISTFGILVSCYFPIERISSLSEIESLRFVRPSAPITR